MARFIRLSITQGSNDVGPFSVYYNTVSQATQASVYLNSSITPVLAEGITYQQLVSIPSPIFQVGNDATRIILVDSSGRCTDVEGCNFGLNYLNPTIEISLGNCGGYENPYYINNTLTPFNGVQLRSSIFAQTINIPPVNRLNTGDYETQTIVLNEINPTDYQIRVFYTFNIRFSGIMGYNIRKNQTPLGYFPLNINTIGPVVLSTPWVSTTIRQNDVISISFNIGVCN